MNAANYNVLQAIIESPVTVKLAWCLLHSLWQIGLIAVLTALAVSAIGERHSSLRYWVAMCGLLLAIAVPTATYLVQPASENTSGTNGSAPAIAAQDFPSADSASSMGPSVPLETASEPREVVPSGPDIADGTSRSLNAEVVDLAEVPPGWQSRVESAAPWITLAWLIGVMVFALRPIVGVGCSLYVRRQGCDAPPESLLRFTKTIADRMNVKAVIRVSHSALVRVPAVVGCFKPMVLVPASSLTGLTARELEAIIAHELAHIKRWDPVFNLLQTIIESILFFHPGLWWLSSIVRRERENSCDDIAVVACGDNRALVRALLSLEEKRLTEPALAANGGPLLKRVRRLTGMPQSSVSPFWQGAVAMTLVGTLLLCALSASHADQNEDHTGTDQQFTSLNITCPTDLYGFGSRTSHDPDLIAKFWNLFPRNQRSTQGETIEDWQADLKLTFRRVATEDRPAETVTVELGMQDGFRWSMGNGIWLMDGQWPLRYGMAEFIRATAESAHEIRTDSLKKLVHELKPETSSIIYRGTDMSDSVLESIGTTCEGLINLDMHECREITDEGVRHLANLQSLRSLRLRFAEKLTAGSAGIIAQLPEIRTLDLSYARGLTTDLAMVDIVKLPNLQNLILVRHSADGITAIGHKLLDDHPNLKRVLVNREGQHPFVEQLAAGPRFIKVADNPGIDYWTWIRATTKQEDQFSRALRDTLRQRAANQRAYDDNRETLQSDHAGKWMAIVAGQVLGPFDSVEAASAGADDMDSAAMHRFIFRPTVDDKDEAFTYSPWMTGSANWWQFGREFRHKHRIGIGPDVWWSGDNKITTADGKASFTMTSIDDANRQVERQAVCSSMVQQQLTITEMDAIELRLNRFSVPGTATSTPYDTACDKVLVEVSIPGLDIREQVTAFVMPHEIVQTDPPGHQWLASDPLILWPQIKSDHAPDSAKGTDKDQGSAEKDDDAATNDKWTVIGTIVDQAGDPLEGVHVWANTGVGTLRCTGEATTDENGKYTVEFTPAMMMNPGEEGADHVGIQASTIFAAKDGYVEQNLCQAGNRMMADKMPEEDTVWGTVAELKDKLILRGQPVTIDFVMVRSASISGYLISADEKLIQKRNTSITGDDLPPSSSVLAQTSADISGHFKFDNVPLDKTWKLEFTIPKTFQDVHSEEFVLDTTGNHEYLITVDIDSDPPSMKMESMDDEKRALVQRLTRELITQRPVIRGEGFVEEELAELEWGPERDGLQAAIRINGGNEYRHGETIDFDFVIRNNGDETIKFESSSWRQEDNIKLQKVDEGFVDVNKAWYSGWPIVSQYVLEPGEAVTLESARFGIEGDEPIDPNEKAAYLAKLDQGSYRFYFRLYFPDINRFDPDSGDNWKGGLYTGEVEFEVK